MSVSVKRKLDFGGNNEVLKPNSSDEFLRLELRKVYAEYVDYWNFDFESEEPMPGSGRWEWSRMAEGEAPEAYDQLVDCGNKKSLASRLEGLSMEEKPKENTTTSKAQHTQTSWKDTQHTLTSMFSVIKKRSRIPVRITKATSPKDSREFGSSKNTKGGKMSSWMLPASTKLPVRT